MYKIKRTNGFKKSFKRCIKRGFDIKRFETVLGYLSESGSVPDAYRPHKLSAKFNYAWECHITSDWILVWQKNEEELILLLVDMGTHFDLF